MICGHPYFRKPPYENGSLPKRVPYMMNLFWICHWRWLSAGQTFFGFLYQFCGFALLKQLSTDDTLTVYMVGVPYTWLGETRNNPGDTTNHTAGRSWYLHPPKKEHSSVASFLGGDGQIFLTVISTSSPKAMFPMNVNPGLRTPKGCLLRPLKSLKFSLIYPTMISLWAT